MAGSTLAIYLLWASLALVAPLLAQPGADQALRRLTFEPAKQYRHEVWSQIEGLPGGPINGIAQTRDGYLWIGTGDGLVRFDGRRFMAFRRANCPQILD